MGAVCSNDAKSCYDLIGHAQAAMAMRRMGVPKVAVDCMFTMLQEAVHRVRTGYGDSDVSYGGKPSGIPMHSICQGNGAGSAIWAVLSSPLLDIQQKRGFGIYCFTPISQQEVRFVGYAFVDDSDLVQMLECEGNYEELMAKMQQVVDGWEGSLAATSDAIVPKKHVGTNWISNGQEVHGDIKQLQNALKTFW